MKILYLGEMTPHSSSWQRARTLLRLGHQVVCHDLERQMLGRSRFQARLHYWTGYRLVQPRTRQLLRETIGEDNFDVAWINGGAIYGPEALQCLHRKVARLVNYNNDDPTGRRDWARWATFRSAIPEYDLCVVVRRPNVSEYYAAGARRVFRSFMSYDEAELVPLPLNEEEKRRWASEVLFVGTWMPERGPFLRKLVEQGVPLTIYGGRWTKSKEWRVLKQVWRSGPVVGPDYVAAVQSAKICLGLVSHGNRDEHTFRSFEIPCIGSLLLAERTSEHRQLFTEDSEAVFWDSPEECAEKCHALLADEARRQAIAGAGHRRVRSLNLTHEAILAEALRLAVSDDFSDEQPENNGHGDITARQSTSGGN